MTLKWNFSIYKPQKWQVQILDAGEKHFPIKLENWQSRGWEIAGPVVVTVSKYGKYLDVPMKKRIK